MTESFSPLTLDKMAKDFFRGKLLCAAVRLGLADALGDHSRSVEELAAKTKSQPDALRRILRALTSIGVVAEADGDRFQLTEFGRPLRRDVPDSHWASIVFWADLLADSWTYLADCARAGSRAGVAQAMEREGVKSRWSREPEGPAIFHAVFAESTPKDMAPFALAHDFSRYTSVADLGGAGGATLAAILQAHPKVRGVLVDRKEAIAGAANKLNALGLADRTELVAGDLLESVPKGADAHILQSVLHGYENDKARQILENCRSALAPAGRVLIIEVVLPGRVVGADSALESLFMADINMLAVTGGRERTAAEWSKLLESAGFHLLHIEPVAGKISSVIEAVPK